MLQIVKMVYFILPCFIILNTSCNNDNDKKERVLLEKENELLKKENDLIRKESEINQKPSINENQKQNDTKSDNVIKKSNSLDGLKERVVKNSSEASFFDDKAVVTRLKKMVGSRYDFLEENWNVTSGLELKNNQIFGEACQIHSCGITEFIILVNYNTNVIYCAMREDGKVKKYSEDNSENEEIERWIKKND
jgi:hypothetical protein